MERVFDIACRKSNACAAVNRSETAGVVILSSKGASIGTAMAVFWKINSVKCTLEAKGDHSYPKKP